MNILLVSLTFSNAKHISMYEEQLDVFVKKVIKFLLHAQMTVEVMNPMEFRSGII